MFQAQEISVEDGIEPDVLRIVLRDDHACTQQRYDGKQRYRHHISLTAFHGNPID